MVSVLTKIFGPENIDLAEDLVQDSLLEAMEHWQYKGVPENPSAWLFRVARNKALNILTRERYKRQYSKEAAHLLQSEWTSEPENHIYSQLEIQDDQLRMIFTCCHPAISPDSQIALALKTLCGFSIPEIARTFLTTEENINKRLVRARQKIRDDRIPFEVPYGTDLDKRLQTVLETIFLLFTEGYSASKGNEIIRYDLCQEAIRLAQILETDKTIHLKGNIYALLALMFLNASRFRARLDKEGNLLRLEEQDHSLWDKNLQGKGIFYLEEATENEAAGIYLILAAISANYSIAPNYEATNWETILSLYDNLLQIDNSPVVLLNRAIVLSKIRGPQNALNELEWIKNSPSMKTYYLFYSTEAELLIELNQYEKAADSLEKASGLAPLRSQQELLGRRLKYCRERII